MKIRAGWLWLLAAAALAIVGARGPKPAFAQPTPNGPIYAVTYFEVAPAAAAKTGGVLRQAAADSRKADGNVEFLALRDTTRAGRFAILEAWRDKAALDAHGAAMKALADKIQPDFVAPFDVRRFWTLTVTKPSAPPSPGALYVLTHVDVFPAGKDEVAAMIKQLAEASRSDKGYARFDAVVGDGHPNHFHLIEAWASRDAFDAYVLTPSTREFRAKLVPFEGALYDERLYETVR